MMLCLTEQERVGNRFIIPSDDVHFDIIGDQWAFYTPDSALSYVQKDAVWDSPPIMFNI